MLVFVGVVVFVGVTVGVWVLVVVFVGVTLAVTVGVAVLVGVSVGVGVFVSVAVGVRPIVTVGVGVNVGQGTFNSVVLKPSSKQLTDGFLVKLTHDQINIVYEKDMRNEATAWTIDLDPKTWVIAQLTKAGL